MMGSVLIRGSKAAILCPTEHFRIANFELCSDKKLTMMLMREKEQLRDEKKLLMEKELLLLRETQRERPRSGAIDPSAPRPRPSSYM